MAHQLTQQEVDERAAAAAAAEEPVATEELAAPPTPSTILAYGAEGECVAKLANLLAVLGYNQNNVIKSGSAKLDESVLVDVRAAQQQLGVSEPELLEPADIAVGVKGELIGEATWHALYEAAAAKLESEDAAASAGASGGDSSS
jgi:hypothetical protein